MMRRMTKKWTGSSSLDKPVRRWNGLKHIGVMGESWGSHGELKNVNVKVGR